MLKENNDDDKKKKDVFGPKFVKYLNSRKGIEDCQTYEEAALAMGYTKKHRNPVRKAYDIALFMAKCLAAKRTIDDARYEMCNVKGKRKKCIVPYRLSQDKIIERIERQRARQSRGSTNSVIRSIDLLQLETKQNPSWDKQKTREAVSRIMSQLDNVGVA